MVGGGNFFYIFYNFEVEGVFFLLIKKEEE